jgi:predicted phosphodiesterase
LEFGSPDIGGFVHRMKLLLFSDLHRDKAAATRIVELARGAEVIIGAGDFANARTGVSTASIF